MPCVFAGSWTLLRVLGFDAAMAFVLAAVFAQTAQVWAVLPGHVRWQCIQLQRPPEALIWAVGAVFVIHVFQVWWAEPWMSQRIVSLVGTLYACAAIMGTRGETRFAERFAPVDQTDPMAQPFQRLLLHLQAGVAATFVVVNETLLFTGPPLEWRVAILSLSPPVLHVGFHIGLWFGCQRLWDEER